MSTSKTKCTLNASKDVKTYKRPLQTITKYFAASSGSPVKLADSPMPLDNTKGTLILQESPSVSSPNSSGVFKVTAKPTIDISKCVTDHFLLDDQLLTAELKPPKPEEQSKDTVSNNLGKRINNESSKSPPAKKAKSDKKQTKVQEKTNARKQRSSSDIEFSFEFSEDEEEKVNVVKCTEVYFCKHCDYSDVSIRCVSTHYQNDHPHIRYNTVYIQDPSDQSATFRCLECPVEFSSVADLEKHHKESHPEVPNVFTVQSRERCLVFKCFVCPFTTNASKALKKHYKEKHPTHTVDNSLMYCRYLVTRCQEGTLQLNTGEKVSSPERPQGISQRSACTPYKEVKNAPSPQHPTSKGAEVALHHCNNCKFSHKSVVVMHVHYQKSHPEETVTIDKIKQSALVTSHTMLQMTPDKSPNSVTVIEKCTSEKNISGSSRETRNKTELSEQKKISLSLINPKHTPEASKTHLESAKTKEVESAEDRSKGKKCPNKNYGKIFTGMDSLSCSSSNELFYCRFCSYSNTSIRSVVGHHNAKHSAQAQTGIEEIVCYSAEVQKKKLQSEAEASARTTSSDSKSGKQVEVCGEKELQHEENEVADALMIEHNAYACAENLFYCQKCNYGNTSVQGVLTHQSKVHHSINSRLEHIIEYTALIRDEIEKSKSKAKELSFLTRLPLPLMNEGDEGMFFCHFCNYRQSTVNHVLRHYFKKHRRFVVKGEQVRLYTSMVLKRTQTSHLRTTASQEVNNATFGKKRNKTKKTKNLDKVSPSIRASQTERTLQCYRCSYSTQYLYVLRRHMCKVHKTNRTITEILKVCFKQGTLQTGYHCDTCVFSHKKATEVYKHYQEQHPECKLSLEYVSTRLYVGPETRPPKKKKPQVQHLDGISNSDTDGSLPSQRPGQNDTKTYSCRACSFKGSSMSSITRHYRAVHPWSVKEDGSVLDVINHKKQSANRQVGDHNEMPVSFDTYQAGLEFDDSLGLSHEAMSSYRFKCSFCPASFSSQRGLNTHCGMKHQEAVTESVAEQQEEQVQSQTRVHVFKCPHCTYVNTSYQGVLTHCQMRHPALTSRADSLYLDEAHLHNWEDCLQRTGSELRLSGYMCKTCQQIFATLEKLNKHCKNGHNETLANTVPDTTESAPAMSKKICKPHSKKGSVSKASFLSKKKYVVIRCQYCSYFCTTKLALGQHLHVRHKNTSASKAQDCLYKCALCSNSYFKQKLLGSHYATKHGKKAFLKYYAPLHKQVHKKPAPTIPDCPLTQQPGNTSEACKSNTTAWGNKKLVYKCPSCSYVNASYHGTLTHCQMKHPDLVARADELQTDEIFVTNSYNQQVGCRIGKGSNERGYMCKKCPQIHMSLKKLKIHYDRDHDRAEATASEHSVKIETEKQPDHSSRGSVLEAFSLKNKTSAMSNTDIGLSHQLGTLETCQSNTPSIKNKELLYKCHICTYIGLHRRYLHCHYKKTHKLDACTTRKLLEKYNKRNRASNLSEAESKESAHVKCKVCPNLKFNSSQLLIAHYSTFHSSDCILDFIVLSQASKKRTGLYKCALCNKQMNGIGKLCHHLDGHREDENMAMASLAMTTTPEARSTELCMQDELPTLETVEELAQWNVTPVETFTLPPSPLLTPSKDDLEQPEPESREGKQTCKQCGRKFMSLKGLRSHERSHAALAAIKKKLNNLSSSEAKDNANKYIIYKAGTLKPFLCSLCSYRTTLMGLWRSHFTKKHQDVSIDLAETGNRDKENAQRTDKEPPNPSDELNNLPEFDEEPEITERSLYSEPPDVQRQLNQYSLMAQAGAPSKANVQETKLPQNSLLHCEVCNFTTGHLSSMRRHYLNRHGKKILKCKDCNFFTGLRKTLEMHIETAHSTCQSEPTHQKDLRCPFCLYQTKNKNNMIDHIVLHREERVMPIELRRSKLSRYLQGIVFRCHKCTFTVGSAENLRLHMLRHNDIKPYKCRLCYFDCTWLSDLEIHLSDKHQVVRNHELVGQISLDQLEARVGRMPGKEEQPLSDSEHHSDNDDSEDVKTEEFVTDCNEVPHETQAKNLTENNFGGNITIRIAEAYQKQGQDDNNGNEEIPAKSSVIDLQYDITKPHSIVREKRERDPQEPAETSFLPDTARGWGIENIAEQKVEGNNAEIQYEDCICPEKEMKTKENQDQPKLRDREDSSVMVTQPKEEAADWSSTTLGKIAEKAQALKLHIKALKQRTLNLQARIEDDVLRHILLLDEDGSICEIHKKTDPDRTVKIEQSMEPEVADGVQNDFFPVDRRSRTLLPNCGQLKISHKEVLGVSFTNCKEGQGQNQKKHEEVRDFYGEMPVVENNYLKEEKYLLACCKEEDQNDYLEQQQDKEDEMITEDDENRCTNQEHQEGDWIKEAENLHVPKDALKVTDGEAEVLYPETTEEKLFTCELCGRNLMNSSELERHVMRHGM